MKWMEIALKEAEKAFDSGEIPVGCVLVKDDKILSRSFNKREKEKNVLSHAEINAIILASKKLKTWKLDEVIMYVTLKPCSMCQEIIKQARIKKVYYLIERLNNKKEYNKTLFEEVSNNFPFKKAYQKKFSDFFVDKR